jgi:hypothetical protein
MAIRRCPYCKAIIDEGSEYCSNCGTQLLFPEDEYIHEEVPGEEIVEEETQEEEKTEKKKSSSRKRKKKEKQQELEEDGPEEEAEQEQAEENSQFEPIEDEKEEGAAEEEIQGAPAEDRDEFFVEEQEPAFGTEDLEKVIDPEEKEKAEIEKFLKSLKEDRDEWDGEIPPTDELPPWAEKIKDEKPEELHDAKPPDQVEEREGEPEESVKEIDEAEEELPEEEQPVEETAEEEILEQEGIPVEEFPFIPDEARTEDKEEVLKPSGLTPEDEVPEVKIPLEETEEEQPIEEEIAEEERAKEDKEEGEREEEVLPEEEKTMPDTGMGLPEGVEQDNLPFSDESPGIFEEDEKSPPSRLSTRLKSRAFDVLFIGAFWIVALHIASRMMSTNLFKLISVSALPAFGFYIALLAVYLFLFFLFLGQTLGDHLFPYEE